MRRPKRGNAPLRFSEILRVIGQYVDRMSLTQIRILETDEAIILQGLVVQGDRIGERDTYQLTPEDILVLLDDAQAKRGTRM